MIEVKNLTKTYHMGGVEVYALRDLTLTINAGDFVAIMGASGSGKSTLMHVLGLLDRPDSGDYFLDGKKVSHLGDEQRALLRNRFMGFVFQQFHLLPRMTAKQNVELPLIYAGNLHLHEKAHEKLVAVGLENRIDHRPNELSGGQQQRVAIARSLVNDPLIIFADEPTGNLDSKSKDEIIQLLKKLNADGKTIVMVTHEPEMATHVKRVITMKDGQIISDKRNAQITSEKNRNEVSNIEKANTDLKASTGMQFFDYLRQAVTAMLAHKLRALLSILGIAIGVAAVIAMIALGRGAQESIQKQLSSLGSNLLMLMSGSSKVRGVAMQQGSVTRFTFQDVTALTKLSNYISDVAPSVSGRGQLVYGNKNWNTQLEGSSPNYEQLRAAIPMEGRFFTEEEVKQRSKVALVGTTVVRELFGDVNPVGETIRINQINFKIIGVLPSRGASTFRDQDDTVLIPVTTAMYRVLGKDYIDTIYIGVADTELMDEAQVVIKDLIIKQHRLNKKEEEDAFQVRNMADIRKAMEESTKTMGLLLGSIAAISLLVGGIGIMNIMLVSVTERTKEIGLRKAIGANNRDIMTQFLIEAVLLSLIGGIIGIIVGSGISLLITLFAGWSVKISLLSLIVATLFSLIVGIVFGLWPARQASQLNPIQALRFE